MDLVYYTHYIVSSSSVAGLMLVSASVFHCSLLLFTLLSLSLGGAHTTVQNASDHSQLYTSKAVSVTSVAL